MSKRAAVLALAAGWLLEWVMGWSQHLGRLGHVISIIWVVLLGYFVFASRHWRIPRAIHTWAWMIALLAVTVLRAWWLGTPSETTGLIELLTQNASSRPPSISSHDVEIMTAMFDVMAVGLVVGFAGAIEATIIALTSWVSDRFRKNRETPRVGLLPRAAVMILQAPIFFALMGAGLAAIGGATQIATHDAPSTVNQARAYVPWIFGFGLAAWALATLHLARLSALASGSVVNRVLLAVVGILSACTMVALGATSVRAIVALLVWVGAQLVAVRFARPATSGAG